MCTETPSTCLQDDDRRLKRSRFIDDIAEVDDEDEDDEQEVGCAAASRPSACMLRHTEECLLLLHPWHCQTHSLATCRRWAGPPPSIPLLPLHSLCWMPLPGLAKCRRRAWTTC
jgi:hypothetical protein